ncbi:MAG TPA: hypothetical protein VL856_01570 [Acidimicrobiia bacterium]|nr:hypothetical protein [Acidimicrobiia bacterium]
MLFDIHRAWGYSAIVANALAGLYTLAAWRWSVLRNRFLWWPTIIAESMMMIQVLLGVLLVSVQDYKPPRFHMFYGFVAFITVGLLYSYKYVWKARGWMELAYGLGGLFIMGLGIRAVLQVVS